MQSPAKFPAKMIYRKQNEKCFKTGIYAEVLAGFMEYISNKANKPFTITLYLPDKEHSHSGPFFRPLCPEWECSFSH